MSDWRHLDDGCPGHSDSDSGHDCLAIADIIPKDGLLKLGVARSWPIDIGIYEVKYDEAVKKYTVNDQLGQQGERRFDTISEAASYIQFDIEEVDVERS